MGYEASKRTEGTHHLIQQPLGQKLYSHIGFDLLAMITVQVEGEEEKLFIGAMMYKEP